MRFTVPSADAILLTLPFIATLVTWFMRGGTLEAWWVILALAVTSFFALKVGYTAGIRYSVDVMRGVRPMDKRVEP